MILRNGSLIRISAGTPKRALTQRRSSLGGKISNSSYKHNIIYPQAENINRLTDMVGYRKVHVGNSCMSFSPPFVTSYLTGTVPKKSTLSAKKQLFHHPPESWGLLGGESATKIPILTRPYRSMELMFLVENLTTQKSLLASLVLCILSWVWS